VALDAHEGEHAQADPAAIDLGAVAGDDAEFLEPLHAAPGGRRRQADAAGELGVRQARVGLQLAQDGDVEPVQPGTLRFGSRGLGGKRRCNFAGFP
jgi:hypothetical protein